MNWYEVRGERPNLKVPSATTLLTYYTQASTPGEALRATERKHPGFTATGVPRKTTTPMPLR